MVPNVSAVWMPRCGKFRGPDRALRNKRRAGKMRVEWSVESAADLVERNPDPPTGFYNCCESSYQALTVLLRLSNKSVNRQKAAVYGASEALEKLYIAS
jgi:hypothetical protein